MIKYFIIGGALIAVGGVGYFVYKQFSVPAPAKPRDASQDGNNERSNFQNAINKAIGISKNLSGTLVDAQKKIYDNAKYLSGMNPSLPFNNFRYDGIEAHMDTMKGNLYCDPLHPERGGITFQDMAEMGGDGSVQPNWVKC